MSQKFNLTENAVFLGATRAPAPDAMSLLPEPKRGNIGDEKWPAKRQEKLQAAAAKAAHWPMTGFIPELCLIDWHDTVLLQSACAGGDTFTTALDLCRFLAEHPNMLPHYPATPTNCVPVRWFGFDIRVTLSMLAVQAMLYNIDPHDGEQVAVPWHIWWHHHFSTPPWLDPFDMMLPSTVRSESGFTASDLAKRFNLTAEAQYSPSRQQAAFARDLVILSGALAGLGLSETT